jgi:hypothetical protein
MGYQEALNLAWTELSGLCIRGPFEVRLLSDVYNIDPENRTVLSSSCNVAAKEQVSLILLHYLLKKIHFGKVFPEAGEWVDFNQLEGGEGYYPAFKKRTINNLIKKYGSNPGSLLASSERFPCTPAGGSDISIIIRAFDDVPIRITMQKADEEFGPDANILYDKNISNIFCTEDVVVLTEFIVRLL